jgi:hypothetical protein
MRIAKLLGATIVAGRRGRAHDPHAHHPGAQVHHPGARAEVIDASRRPLPQHGRRLGVELGGLHRARTRLGGGSKLRSPCERSREVHVTVC